MNSPTEIIFFKSHILNISSQSQDQRICHRKLTIFSGQTVELVWEHKSRGGNQERAISMGQCLSHTTELEWGRQDQTHRAVIPDLRMWTEIRRVKMRSYLSDKKASEEKTEEKLSAARYHTKPAPSCGTQGGPLQGLQNAPFNKDSSSFPIPTLPGSAQPGATFLLPNPFWLPGSPGDCAKQPWCNCH